MSRVSIVYNSKALSCGIAQFSKHLSAELALHGWTAIEYNWEDETRELEPSTIVHYVPSMWAGDGWKFHRLLRRASEGRVVVLLHGMYPPSHFNLRSDTPCLDLPDHITSISRYASAIVALSASCGSMYRLWFVDDSRLRVVKVLPHPGTYAAPTTTRSASGYVFFGGVFRPKKDVTSLAVRALLDNYAREGIKVWVHVANRDRDVDRLPVWRMSAGLLKDEHWASALNHAVVVICPYDTEVQCVSGVISEALSVGTPVISTDFPFSREMQHRYPRHVLIENYITKWPDLTTSLMQGCGPIADYPGWSRFVSGLISELDGTCQ